MRCFERCSLTRGSVLVNELAAHEGCSFGEIVALYLSIASGTV